MGLIEDAKRIEAGNKLATLKQRFDDLIASAAATVEEMEAIKRDNPSDSEDIDKVISASQSRIVLVKP